MRTDTEGKIRPAYQVAFTGMLFALSMALAFLEGLLPTVAFFTARCQAGPFQYYHHVCAVLAWGKKSALIAVLKSICAFDPAVLWRDSQLKRRNSFGSSNGGSICHLKEKVSYLTVSILGSRVSQYWPVGSIFLLQTEMVLYYLPVLILSGIGMGLIQD